MRRPIVHLLTLEQAGPVGPGQFGTKLVSKPASRCPSNLFRLSYAKLGPRLSVAGDSRAVDAFRVRIDLVCDREG